MQLNEEQLQLWLEEEDDDSSKLGTNQVVSKSSGEKGDKGNKRNEGKEAPMEEIVDLEKHLLACRSSLVHKRLKPCCNGPADNQPSSSSPLSEQSRFSSTNVPAETQPSISQLSSKTPLGLRAHITLGCAKGVRPMQTGLDQV